MQLHYFYSATSAVVVAHTHTLRVFSLQSVEGGGQGNKQHWQQPTPHLTFRRQHTQTHGNACYKEEEEQDHPEKIFGSE